MSQDTFETMKVLTEILLFLFCIARVTLALISSPGIQCFVPGECLDSQILDARPTDTSRACLNLCQNLTGCEWFTWYTDSKVCTSLSGCLSLTEEKCGSNCISGEQECPEIQCGIQGRCYGALEGIRKVGSDKECGSICGQRSECTWFSYSNQTNSCTMTNDCPALDRSCDDCLASETSCAVTTENEPTGDFFFLFRENIAMLNRETGNVFYRPFKLPTTMQKEKMILSVYDDKLILLTFNSSSRDLIGCSLIDAQSDWNCIPHPSCHSHGNKKFPAIRLIDGRLWMTCGPGQFTVTFDGKTFFQSKPTPWFASANPITNQGFALLNDEQIIVAGGRTIYGDFLKAVYVLDLNGQGTEISLPELPRVMNEPYIWKVVLDGRLKIVFAGDLYDEMHVVILDWTSNKYTSLNKTEDFVPPSPQSHLRITDATIFYSKNKAYFVWGYYDHTLVYDLQNFASTNDTKAEIQFYGEKEISKIHCPTFINLQKWINGPESAIFTPQGS
ncbi:uncharacterized protein LOC131882454 isoform X2 [Tigriopus californicus]|uniref:uncharacterized protein LOC131882454 isoform X2 n=1 Tax=Tigriopus californicus TaxID=6832 RepID=UPI0027DA9481|nr:uncharacterized protein LOC131882454 isoform X2 [Tigriopus californicus]